MLAGGGFNVGQAIGETDRQGARSTGKPYTPSNILATPVNTYAPAILAITHTDGQILHGENLELLPRLAASSFQLIYIDPPFNTGRAIWFREGCAASGVTSPAPCASGTGRF